MLLAYADALFDDQQYRRALVCWPSLLLAILTLSNSLSLPLSLSLWTQHYYRDSTKVLAQAEHNEGRTVDKVGELYTPTNTIVVVVVVVVCVCVTSYPVSWTLSGRCIVATLS